MVTIQNEYGTFTGETERAALAAARKGKRAAQLENERKGKEYSAAITDAAANGFRLLSRLVQGERVVRNGEWFGTDHKDANKIFDCFSEHKTELSAGCLTIAAGNPVRIDHYGFTFRGVLLNSGGWIVGYLLTDDNDMSADRDQFYAIGCSGGSWATARVPGITLETLTQSS